MHILTSQVSLQVALVVLATFVLVDEKNILDANTAFVSMAFINLLVIPFFLLPEGVSVIGQVNAN